MMPNRNKQSNITKADANFPDQNVQLHSVTSIETARSLANGPSWEGGGD